MKTNSKTILDINSDPGLRHKGSPQVVKKPKLPMDIPQFHLRKDKPDSRDYKYALIPKVAPNIVDLRPFCSPIENQGNLGSCTGQAVAGAIELLHTRNSKPLDVSRLFIYYFERLILGTVNYDSGAYIRDGIKATNKYGAPKESLWPYLINMFRSYPAPKAIEDGVSRKVTLYERVMNFDGCINALANGFPVIIGFTVYSSFVSTAVARTGNMPYPKTNRESILGGHAVLLVGYDMSRKVFIVRNSWGTAWGDKGYFYMPFDVIKNPAMSTDFWIIKSVNHP
tara:strand:- start:368 stop:1213 length:846 start_codon:yes stop_codon:yes gene_type:complete